MAALELQQVSKTFGNGELAVRAVQGVSLTVVPGEVVLIMGPSGSGKTTLLAMAGCLMRPDSGRVLVDGTGVSGLSEKELAAIRRQKVGFIFQSFNLLSTLTAQENVELVLELCGRGRELGRAGALLGDLGLSRRAGALPGLLSGGERQRVAIARALANDPAVILADEPTANLDSRSGQQVAELLARAARERCKAVVIVSHDTRLREVADRVVWMEDGAIRN